MSKTITTTENDKFFRGEVIISGVTYMVSGHNLDGRRIVNVNVRRVREDGSIVWAFLSARQRRAETAARMRFANELNAFFLRIGI